MTSGDSELLKGYESALADLANIGKTADAKAASLNREYARSIQSPITKALNSATGQAIGAGVGSSSIYRDALGDISTAAQKAGIEQQEKSNQWAADTKIAGIKDTVTAQENYAGLMKDLLGLSEYSTSSTTSGSKAASTGSNESESSSESWSQAAIDALAGNASTSR